MNHKIEFAHYLKNKGVPEVKYTTVGVTCMLGTYLVLYDPELEKTGRLQVTTVEDSTKNQLGWFFTTKAQHLVMFFSDVDFLNIEIEDLRDCWYDQPELWIMREIENKIVWEADCKHISNLHMGRLK